MCDCVERVWRGGEGWRGRNAAERAPARPPCVGEAKTGKPVAHASPPHTPTPTQGPKGELELNYPDLVEIKKVRREKGGPNLWAARVAPTWRVGRRVGARAPWEKTRILPRLTSHCAH